MKGTGGFKLAWKFSRINPIENFWPIIKQKLLKEHCSTLANIIIEVIRTWYHDEEMTKNCSELVESILNWVQMLVKAKRRSYVLLCNFFSDKVLDK